MTFIGQYAWLITMLYIVPSLWAAEVVAVVGDQVISNTALARREVLLKKIIPEYQQIEPEKIRRVILESMMDELMQEQIAQRAGITLTEQESKEAFSRMAAMQKKTVAQLETQLRQDGVDIKEFRAHVAMRASNEKLQRIALLPRVHVGLSELAGYRDKIKSAHEEYYIKDVVFFTEESDSMDKKKQQALDFAELWRGKKIAAKDLPEGSEMYQYAWQPLTELPAVLQQTVSTMSAREVSSPLKTGNGWHVLKMVKRRLPKDMALDDASVRQVIGQERLQMEMARWLTKYRQQMYRKIYL